MAVSSKKRSGFTLIEILAATGIMVVIIMLVLSLTTNVLSSWTRASGQLQNNFEARVAMDLLQSDLESMVVRNRNIVWLQVEYDSPLVAGADPTPKLYFFAPTLQRPRKKSDGTEILGDVCAISYRLAYQNPFLDNKARGDDPSPIFGLYRAVVDAENTFEQALAIPAYDPSTPGTTLADYWNSGSSATIDEAGNAIGGLSVWAIDDSNFLSQNVAKFELLFWYKIGGNLYAITSTPLDAVGTGTPAPFVLAGSSLYLDGSTAPKAGARLAYVDVKLTVLSPEGAALFNQGKDYNDVIKTYGDVFTRRINLMGNPL